MLRDISSRSQVAGLSPAPPLERPCTKHVVLEPGIEMSLLERELRRVFGLYEPNWTKCLKNNSRIQSLQPLPFFKKQYRVDIEFRDFGEIIKEL